MMTQTFELKYPIVLVHGLGAKSQFGPIDYFYGMSELLEGSKNRYFKANLTSWHRIEHRAQELKNQIRKAFPDEKVNIIAHSMGGLDARYLASRLNFSEQITSITTIGTPHRGTSLSDFTTSTIPSFALTRMDQMLKLFDLSTHALKQVSQKYCLEVFSQMTPNVPSIAYYSATTQIAQPVRQSSLPIFWLPHKLIHKKEGDNDGFVSVESAKWGEHICTYTGDHYAQIGHFLGKARGLDYIQFYSEILRRLKWDGM
jgi:triacylglycerol lipase